MHNKVACVAKRKCETVRLSPEMVLEIRFEAPGWSGVPMGHFAWQLLAMALEVG